MKVKDNQAIIMNGMVFHPGAYVPVEIVSEPVAEENLVDHADLVKQESTKRRKAE